MSCERPGRLSRRSFIRQVSALAAGGAAVGSVAALGQAPAPPPASAPNAPTAATPVPRAAAPATAPAPSTQAAGSQPSNRIRLGFIGMGGRASQYLQDFLAQPDVS